MRTNKWLVNKIILPIYRQMYKEAVPSADFDGLCASLGAKGKVFDWEVIKNYYLPLERQTEIIEEYRKKYKLTKQEMHKVKKEVYLGCSPRSW